MNDDCDQESMAEIVFPCVEGMVPVIYDMTYKQNVYDP